MSRFAIFPAPRLLWLAAAGALVAALVALLSMFGIALPMSDQPHLLGFAATLAIALALGDYLLALLVESPKVRRDVAHNLPLNVWTTVRLELETAARRVVTVELFDQYLDGADVEPLPVTVRLRPGMTTTIEYRLRPAQRGPVRFGRTQLRIPSPLGLWQCSRFGGEETSVRVYPDFAAVARYQLLAIDQQTQRLGIRKRPRRGEGLEFHQLRDYRSGDSLRQIDWKATARRERLTSREYQDERDQQILFLMDCGRHMRTQDGLLSHFDHALNALLLLSYVALRQGDAVGLLSFGGERRRLPPAKGGATVNTILNAVYDLHPTTHAPDYRLAAQELLAYQRKRAMVVLITNLREESTEDLLPAVKLLRRRHLVLLAGIREAVLDETLSEPVEDFKGALDYSAAAHYVALRQRTLRRLRQMGVWTVDVPAGQVPVQVVNGYLAVKRSGRL